ncbi:hypothetical protein ABW19_dt0205280 [Dactylella cylindrospora]|nr:hypothetical protein ABW19_dt0205280 [Dactylella cylindrospora]
MAENMDDDHFQVGGEDEGREELEEEEEAVGETQPLMPISVPPASRSDEVGRLEQHVHVRPDSVSDGTIADEEERARQDASSGSTARPVSLRGLYISHFLSTWNARTYEFAAVVFTVEAFPNTLLPASISGIAQCITSILLSPSIGAWADRSPSRLNALKTTIIVQRFAVLAACACWTFLLWSPSRDGEGGSQPTGLKWSILSVIVALSCVERLAAGGNVVVMERDWVPTLAPAVGESSLHILNATMRRIDLICKVLAPGFVTLLPTGFGALEATAEHSIFWSVIVIAAMSLMSPWVEWISAQRVWSRHGLLQAPKMVDRVNEEMSEERNWGEYLRHKLSGLIQFCRSAVFLPTISISLMYLSVLTFSSPMITFLLNAGFSLPVVTIARLFSSLLEVSATAVMPWGVKTIKNRPVKYWRHVGEDELPAVYGVIGLTSTPPPTIPGLPTPYFSLPMLLGVAFSRIGLWTYDLAYSQLQQTLPPPSLRGEFTGIEQSFISASELLQWTLTAIMSRPEEFNILACTSWVAVLGAAACYAWFIRKRRGHLLHVHVSSCCKS